MASLASKYELTDEQRIELIERARRELPELDRVYREAIERLRRFTKGTASPSPMVTSDASKYELTDDQRAKLIEKARRELPEHDRRFKEAMEGLRRIAYGDPRPRRYR